MWIFPNPRAEKSTFNSRRARSLTQKPAQNAKTTPRCEIAQRTSERLKNDKQHRAA
jgi:hypothetical protein